MKLVSLTAPEEGIAVLTLNRVDKLNALSHAMMDEFLAHLASLHKSCPDLTTRAVIVCSASPKAFCVGADLSERMKMNDKEVSDTLDKQRRIMDGIAALAAPTLAVVNGAAFGGGLELALACDLRVASPGAQMGLTETRLAIIPGAGGTQRLTRIVGLAKSKELIYLGRRIDGAEALSLGLVNACHDDPFAAALEWARTIRAGGPKALVAAKRAIDGGMSLELHDALDLERECYESVLKSEDRIEGLRAFAEKRNPAYKGR
jgi:methylglutaconyl-CoA hydratase